MGEKCTRGPLLINLRNKSAGNFNPHDSRVLLGDNKLLNSAHVLLFSWYKKRPAGGVYFTDCLKWAPKIPLFIITLQHRNHLFPLCHSQIKVM